MLRATTAIASLLSCLALITGCSDPAIEAGNKTGSTGAGPSATPEPFAGMSTGDIYKKVKKDVAAAKTVHMAANLVVGKDKIAFNLKVSRNGRAFGTITTNGNKVAVRRIGSVLYLKGSRGFWLEDGDAATADLLAGKWIKGTKRGTKALTDMFEFTELDFILDEFLAITDEEADSMTRVPGVPAAGAETIGLADAAKGEETEESGKLYIATKGPSLPLLVTIDQDKSQYMKFRRWDKPFKVVKPAKVELNLDTAT
jgi:hypothetical protein